MTKQQEFRKQTEEAKFEAFSLMCKKVADLEKEVKYQTEDSKKWQNMYKQRCEECRKLEKENARLTTNEKTLLTERKIIVKENAELKSELTKKADTNHSLVEQMADLESKNAELKEQNSHLYNDLTMTEAEYTELKAKNKWYSEQVCNKECAEVWGMLTKATEHIRTLISCLIDWVQEGDKDYCYIADAEQFLKEIEKCNM